MKDEKWFHTMEIYDEYERRFASARAGQTFRDASDPKVREEILWDVKTVLGYKEELLPNVHNIGLVSSTDFDTYEVRNYRFETWEHFYSSAELFLPHDRSKKLPLTILFCGHGDEGRLSPGYLYMGHRLAKMGIAVLIPNNIGQGDRDAFGHRFCVAPFYCGTSVQGMILMESVALVRHMAAYPVFDSTRFASCGNSGGGTLNLFIAALAAKELCAVAATGYTSQFDYILSKERRHCCCNLLPGVHGKLEMWEILSLFAPKPLLVEQGNYDNLISIDLFLRNARKVENTYIQLGAKENFRHEVTETLHSWAAPDRTVISKFLCGVFGIEHDGLTEDEDPALLKNVDSWIVRYPEEAVSTDRAAQNITGVEMPEGTNLWDVFPPQYKGRKVTEDEIVGDIGRGQVIRILAQLECTLCDNRRKL